jgi:hypothetical protein
VAIDFDTLALAPCLEAFGQPVTYRPGAARPVTLTGIYNRFSTTEVIDTQTGLTLNVTRPTVAIRQADIPSGIEPCQGEAIEAGGIFWAIADVIPDGMGQVLLQLVLPQA